MPVTQTLSKPFNVTEIRNTIQQTIKNSKDKFKMSWIKAHVVIQGNEYAEELAKHAALNRYNAISYHIRKPITTLKRTLKELTIKQWQLKCDYGETGRLTHRYFSNIDCTY